MAREDDHARRARLTAALERVGRGDRDALREVYGMTAAKLFGICLRISKDREIAEDILQDVYIKVWNRAGRFEADRASPITWLSVIARNTAIDWLRAQPSARFVDQDHAVDVADDRPDAVATIGADQQRARILECLDALEPRQRDAIRQAFFDGFTYAELADRLQVPLGTMKSWVRRGLLQMRECVGDA